MHYCSNCGSELADEAAFCPNCGQEQNSAPQSVQRRSTSNRKRLHCPECGSVTLSPIVETEISGGMAVNRSVTRKTSASAMRFNNTHRNYWMCSECGHKFRNLQNLEEELTFYLKGLKGLRIFLIVVVVLTILEAFAIGVGFALVVGSIFVLTMGIIIVMYKSRASKLKAEKAYLEKHCFD